MPNCCWNKLTIKATYEQITQIISNEFINVKSQDFQQFLQGKEVFIFRIRSFDRPNKDLMNNLFEKYDGIWIKNIWQEESGQSGIIVGTKDFIQEIEWDEGDEEEWNIRLEECDFPDIIFANDNDESNE